MFTPILFLLMLLVVQVFCLLTFFAYLLKYYENVQSYENVVCLTLVEAMSNIISLVLLTMISFVLLQASKHCSQAAEGKMIQG